MYGLSASNLAASTQFSSQAQANAAAAFGNLATSAVSSGIFNSGGGTTESSAPVTSDNYLVPIDYGTGGGTEINLPGGNTPSYLNTTYNIPGGGYNQ